MEISLGTSDGDPAATSEVNIDQVIMNVTGATDSKTELHGAGSWNFLAVKALVVLVTTWQVVAGGTPLAGDTGICTDQI